MVNSLYLMFISRVPTVKPITELISQCLTVAWIFWVFFSLCASLDFVIDYHLRSPVSICSGFHSPVPRARNGP